MSDDFSEFLVDDQGDQQDTNLVSTLRAQLKKAAKLIKEKDEKLAALDAKDAERAVSAVWDDLSVPDAIRKLYQGDKDSDAIKAWWEESKGLFNIQATDQQQEQQGSPEQQEQLKQLTEVQNASALGDSQGVTSGFDAAIKKAAELTASGKVPTDADLDEFFKLAGLPRGVIVPPQM